MDKQANHTSVPSDNARSPRNEYNGNMMRLTHWSWDMHSLCNRAIFSVNKSMIKGYRIIFTMQFCRFDQNTGRTWCLYLSVEYGCDWENLTYNFLYFLNINNGDIKVTNGVLVTPVPQPCLTVIVLTQSALRWCALKMSLLLLFLSRSHFFFRKIHFLYRNALHIERTVLYTHSSALWQFVPLSTPTHILSCDNASYATVTNAKVRSCKWKSILLQSLLRFCPSAVKNPVWHMKLQN